MNELGQVFINLAIKNSLVFAFAFVGILVWISNFVSARLTANRIHGSAIAIFIGLVLAYLGGLVTGGKKGLSDLELFTGIGLMGSSMLRDFTIVATAYGVSLQEFRRTGYCGIVALLAGVTLSFMVGIALGWVFGYRDAESLTTIGAGTATYIVGPVTGGAVGASSEVIAISVAAGLVKSILVMILTPVFAPVVKLDNAKSALIFGGIMGTTSGVAAGLAATDEKLVPYGAMTATFYTGLGCLLGPSFFYLLLKLVCPS